jgi:hypothetical protein
MTLEELCRIGAATGTEPEEAAHRSYGGSRPCAAIVWRQKPLGGPVAVGAEAPFDSIFAGEPLLEEAYADGSYRFTGRFNDTSIILGYNYSLRLMAGPVVRG